MDIFLSGYLCYQESPIFRPLLSILYIDDLHAVVKSSSLKIYANDVVCMLRCHPMMIVLTYKVI